MTNVGYKLTDSNDRTRGGTQWGLGVTYTAPGEGELCGPGWLRFYSSPVLAVLMDPIHAGYLPTGHMWEVNASGRIVDEGTQSGAQSVTTIRRVDVPEISLAQRVRWAIYSVQEAGGWRREVGLVGGGVAVWRRPLVRGGERGGGGGLDGGGLDGDGVGGGDRCGVGGGGRGEGMGEGMGGGMGGGGVGGGVGGGLGGEGGVGSRPGGAGGTGDQGRGGMTPSRPAGYALRAVFGDRGDEPERVLAEVARGFGVGVEDIRGPSRTTVVATARMCACAVLREATALSYPAIGRLVERDHTTVMHHHRRVMRDAELRSGVLAIAAELAAQRAGADPIHYPVQEG